MLANVLECVFGLCQSSGKEKESCYLPRQNVKLNALSSCSRATMVKKCKKKNVMHVQSCCFANINLLPLCRSHFRRLRRCSSSLLPNKLQLTDGKLQLTLINTKWLTKPVKGLPRLCMSYCYCLFAYLFINYFNYSIY